jgi:hypothetical protein
MQYPLSLIKTSRIRRIRTLQRHDQACWDSIEPCSRGSDTSSDGFSVRSARVRISCLRISFSVSNCWRCTPSVHVADYRLGTRCLDRLKESLVWMAEAFGPGDATDGNRLAPGRLPAVLEMALPNSANWRTPTDPP